MKLGTLAILLGTAFSIPNIYGLMNPKGFIERARKFPRSEAAGYLLMFLGTIWFLYNLNQETISDFAAYKKAMLVGFASLGFLTCIFVRDYLAVRGLAVFLLMLACYTLSLTRWAVSPWRLVLAVWAYLWIASAMWFTVSPWRLRDLIQWMTSSEGRVRTWSVARLGFGILVIILGCTALR